MKLMKRVTALLLTACLLLLPVKAGGALPFGDVVQSAWYYEDVQYAYEAGLMQGTSDSTFSPEATATRAMLVTILYRMEGSPAVTQPAAFRDVAENRWFTAPIAWAAETGLINGVSETLFCPDVTVSREQAAAILYRYAAYKGCDMFSRAGLEGFADRESVHDWAAEALCWAVDCGLLQGNRHADGTATLDPGNGTTRAQLAALLHRFHATILNAAPLRVAYIPLDNRPVNDQRPVYLMDSAGMEVCMPEESLYATRLDNQEPNPNGTTYGDREALLAWLKTMEDCDIFILSMDQLLSGGLVSSRAIHHEDLEFEYAVIDYIAALAETKPVYVFDTVMRLASTVNYGGMGAAEYSAFRKYGAQKRAELTGELLTIENIFAGYRYDENGEPIGTSLTEEALADYHAARRRKLLLADRLLGSSSGFAALMIGVDDSYPDNSIQSNEIAYLRARLVEEEYLFCGTDELGMMAVARACADHYGFTAPVTVRYFGGGEDEIVDEFDTATVRDAVEQHLSALRMASVPEGGLAEVLVLCADGSPAAAEAFMDAWEDNDARSVPTIVIDTSNSSLTFDRLVSELPVTHLLGYSCWGTGGNTIGLALSMGLTRLTWLENVRRKTAQETDAFLQSLTFALIKDVAYCRGCRSSVQDLSPEGLETLLLSQGNTQSILQGLEGKAILNAYGSYTYCPTVCLTDFSAPFNRSYEIRFQILLEAIQEPPAEPES